MRQKKNDYGFYKKDDLMEHHTAKEKAPKGKGFNDRWLYTPFYLLAFSLIAYALNRPIVAGYIETFNTEIKVVLISLTIHVLLYIMILPGLYKANKILIADFCTKGKAVNYILNIVVFIFVMSCILLNLYGVLDYSLEKEEILNNLLISTAVLYSLIMLLNITRLSLTGVDISCKNVLKTTETGCLILQLVMMILIIVYKFYPAPIKDIGKMESMESI